MEEPCSVLSVALVALAMVLSSSVVDAKIRRRQGPLAHSAAPTINGGPASSATGAAPAAATTSPGRGRHRATAGATNAAKDWNVAKWAGPLAGIAAALAWVISFSKMGAGGSLVCCCLWALASSRWSGCRAACAQTATKSPQADRRQLTRRTPHRNRCSTQAPPQGAQPGDGQRPRGLALAFLRVSTKPDLRDKHEKTVHETASCE